MERNKHLKRLATILIINAPYLPTNGLVSGKMGAVLFFYQLGRKLNNKQYTEFADHLLDTILENLHISASNRFTTGLTGLAWGVEYLIQNGFIEADSNDILEELDINIFQLDRKKPSLTRIYGDYYGYGLYYLRRASKDIHWNDEALEVLIADLKALLTERPLEVTANYLISVLYIIKELTVLGVHSFDDNEFTTWLYSWLETHQMNEVEVHSINKILETSITEQTKHAECLALTEQDAQYRLFFSNADLTILDKELLTELDKDETWANLFVSNASINFNTVLTQLTWAQTNLL